LKTWVGKDGRDAWWPVTASHTLLGKKRLFILRLHRDHHRDGAFGERRYRKLFSRVLQTNHVPSNQAGK
jgi:hypothetical protein